MRPNVYAVLCNYSTDPSGNPLALVIYRNRTYEYIPHAEIEDSRSGAGFRLRHDQLNRPQRVLQEV